MTNYQDLSEKELETLINNAEKALKAKHEKALHVKEQRFPSSTGIQTTLPNNGLVAGLPRNGCAHYSMPVTTSLNLKSSGRFLGNSTGWSL